MSELKQVTFVYLTGAPESRPLTLWDRLFGKPAQDGIESFRLTCERDLEDMVGKLKQGRYGEGWYKIRNPSYSQREGRRELFEKRVNVSTYH